MVRKWSYLSQNYLQIYKSFNSIKKVKTFKVFRKTTKFKKFTKGLTRVVKIKYMKRLFFSNYLVLKQITKWWSLNYIQWKQLSRFSQSFFHSQILSHGPNFEIFNEAPRTTDRNLNLHLFSCSMPLLKRFIWDKVGFPIYTRPKTFFIQSKLKNSKLSFIQTDSFDSSQNSDITYSLNFNFNNLNYHPYSNTKVSDHTLLYKSLVSTTFNFNLQLTLSIYKILISSTLSTIRK